jgi:ribonuclease J
MNNQLSFLPLGGIGDVTKNMYLYEYNNQILVVDCGLGFADETMLGVDLLLPDVTYLINRIKYSDAKVVGMALTHGHEDHIGALPFLLDSLPSFPIFGTPFTAALANEKLKEFGAKQRVETVSFDKPDVKLGDFGLTFVKVTHSVPDTSNIFIRTPMGNFYHASDFKFDNTPFDGKTTNITKIESLGKEGIVCLMSDCLGVEKAGFSKSEISILDNFEKEIQSCHGKFIVTTYSSNISRINQVIRASEAVGRKVCFVGRSFTKTTEVAQRLGYMRLKKGTQIELSQIKNYKDSDLTLLVAGSQGQEESAMSRIANREHREIKLNKNDEIIFSADPIPGNELSMYAMIDTLAKTAAKILYSAVTRNFHVSGHGSFDDLKQMASLVKPKWFVPIGGNFRHMALYKNVAKELGYQTKNVLLTDDGQEIVFTKDSAGFGKKVPLKKVYVDEISGEELESFVLRDRQKLSTSGIAIVLAEIDSENGQLINKPDIIIRGFTQFNMSRLSDKLFQELKRALGSKRNKVTNWIYVRKLIGKTSERIIFQSTKRRPLVLPVVIEV